MKRNFFGEAICQPGDDIGIMFFDAFDTEPSAVLTARDLEQDPEFGWTCTVTDEELNEIQVHDYPTEEALRDWLAEQEIEIDG